MKWIMVAGTTVRPAGRKIGGCYRSEVAVQPRKRGHSTVARARVGELLDVQLLQQASHLVVFVLGADIGI